MPFLLIDRRKAGKGKSTNNRQKLVRRIKGFIKNSIPQNIGQGSVTGNNSNSSSPVVVAGSALEEPCFAYAKGGEYTAVVIGNDKFDRGDVIELEDSEGSSPTGGPGDQGEDDFVVNIARDEFLNVFFEDCELPNLDHEKATDKLENTFHQAGFTSSGNPAQLSIIRSFKQSLARRWALQGPHKEAIAEYEKELELLEGRYPGTEYLSDERINRRIDTLRQLIEEEHAKILALDGFDKVDLRYKKKEAQPLKTIESVLVMIMDISGSMGQHEKTVARRWFALLYEFIKRRYGSTDLVFIAHTDEAFELNEGDFFSTRINGGTSVSPAIIMADQIIKERYDPSQTNIYVCHASDGDNWATDDDSVYKELTKPGGLANKIQMFSYIEIGREPGSPWYTQSSTDTNLWSVYEKCQDKLPQGKMSLAKLDTADDCYPVFKKVFKKRSQR